MLLWVAGIAISDKSGRIYHANAALLSMFPEAHGQTVPDVFVEGTMEDSRLTLPIDTKQGKRILEVSKHGASRFSDGHLKGSLNIPYNRSFPNWAGWLLDYERYIFLIAEEGRIGEIRKALSSDGGPVRL